MPDFRKAVDSLIRIEGGFSNHSWDNGGATKYGITHKTLGMHLGLPGPAPVEKVKELDLITARIIYNRFVWMPMKCAQLSQWDAAYTVFDAAVNHGNRGATKLIQRTLRVAEDGILGPVTLNAMQTADAAEFVRQLQRVRKDKYMALDDFDKAGKGWLNRIIDTLAIAWVGPLPLLPDNSTDDPGDL